jgi:large subunit ribosomal protein L9
MNEEKKMELILKRTIDNLGEEGDVVKVKPGFGRNYLLPQQLAVTANKANLAILEIEKDSIVARKKAQNAEAEELAGKLAGVTISIEKRVGEEDKLYGSVTSGDIAEKLAEIGIQIDKRKIVLDEPIKTIGVFTVSVKVGYQVSSEVKVEVVAEKTAA